VVFSTSEQPVFWWGKRPESSFISLICKQKKSNPDNKTKQNPHNGTPHKHDSCPKDSFNPEKRDVQCNQRMALPANRECNNIKEVDQGKWIGKETDKRITEDSFS